jgi:hypothetical protein
MKESLFTMLPLSIGKATTFDREGHDFQRLRKKHGDVCSTVEERRFSAAKRP